MQNLWARLWQEEDGQDLVEYSLLVTLVAFASIISIKTLASAISNVYSSAASSLTSTS